MCDRTLYGNIDLLTYNLIMYGKSWYELKGNAVIDTASYSQATISKYKRAIEKLRSSEFKSTFNLDKLFRYIYQYNRPATNIVNETIIAELYNTSDTFPEFIQKLNGKIAKKDKCNFYKSWLEQIVYDNISNILRNYIIHIEQVGSGRKYRGRRKTRKQFI